MPDRAAVVEHNARELVKMEREAAALAGQFFAECERRGTLVQFDNAQEDGNTVEVSVVDGPPEKMALVARLLDMILTGNTLEV